MKFGPKYKKCKRVGERVFGKCENPQFEMAPPSGPGKKRRKARSEYGIQLNEKQKARYTYGVKEKQFANYVKRAAAARRVSPAEELYQSLERRLDNVVYRGGFAKTRQQARQLVAHGHILVNERPVNVPSFTVSEGDVVRLKERTQNSPLFANMQEWMKGAAPSEWLQVDPRSFTITVKGVPHWQSAEVTFNLKSVIEFYSR